MSSVNSLVKGELAIHDLDELERNIASFEHHEARTDLTKQFK